MQTGSGTYVFKARTKTTWALLPTFLPLNNLDWNESITVLIVTRQPFLDDPKVKESKTLPQGNIAEPITMYCNI
jgi:hypothetical protein